MTFQPGQSGNPKGHVRRPRILTQRLIAELNDSDGAKLHRLVNVLVDRALEGDIAAAKEIFDRVEGKPEQPVQISGDEANPLAIVISAGQSLEHKFTRLLAGPIEETPAEPDCA